MTTNIKTFIITGGNSGLGYQCAKNIALNSADNFVLIACRSEEKSARAVAALIQETGNVNVQSLKLDLASLVSVRAFCKAFNEGSFPPLHGLVCNAIVGSVGHMEYTTDGFELTFGVGHLGHFLLANLLLDKMENGGRVLFVSSDQHDPPKALLRKMEYTDARCFAYPEKNGTSNHLSRYSMTKLCNIYCAYEMAARIAGLDNKAITVNAFNPGYMGDTGLSANGNPLLKFAIKFIGPVIAMLLGTLSSSVKSGKLLADLMIDERYNGITGKYFDRGKELRSSELSYSRPNAVNLWEQSIELVRLQKGEAVLSPGDG